MQRRPNERRSRDEEYGGSEDDSQHTSSSSSDLRPVSRKRRRNWLQKLVLSIQIYEQRNSIVFYLVTVSVFVSSFLWIAYMLYLGTSDGDSLSERERIRQRVRHDKHRPLKLVQNFKDGVNVVAEKIQSAAHLPVKKKTPGSVEDLPSDCYRPAWQDLNLPNCNRVHEMDLLTSMRGDSRTGFLADGLWRDVFAVQEGLNRTLAVLKIMKPKHDVNERNFDRHRRDALSMERLTSARSIVDIFGFCGNTVATEFVAQTLYDVAIYGDNIGDLTRSTPQGRLEMFIEATKGLVPLHEIPGGPIVHADLQARQLLVRPDGSVALNDYNRCRFVGHHNDTHQTPCPLRIPSAPGRKRSPEEYDMAPLNEKLDIFSLGNVYYLILTGEDPFESLSTNELQSYVAKGTKPNFPPMESEIDQKLKAITLAAFERDPSKRLSAKALLNALAKIKTDASIG